MTESSPADDRRKDRWHLVVVPTARSIEGFAWRVAWFTVFVKILFFS